MATVTGSCQAAAGQWDLAFRLSCRALRSDSVSRRRFRAEVTAEAVTTKAVATPSPGHSLDQPSRALHDRVELRAVGGRQLYSQRRHVLLDLRWPPRAGESDRHLR